MQTESAKMTPVAGKTRWAWTLATFFGAGYGKPGPGTWGSAAAVLLWAAYAVLVHPGPTGLATALGVGIVLAIAFGVASGTIVARETGVEDPQIVVIDEVAGQWVALLGCTADWKHGLTAFVLFRLFDMTKPFPLRRLERLPGGWGIVFDDVGAGLYALAVVSLLRIWF